MQSDRKLTLLALWSKKSNIKKVAPARLQDIKFPGSAKVLKSISNKKKKKKKISCKYKNCDIKIP
jgi:hypothetical protein